MNEVKQDKVIVRYPPSPTGKLHVGNIRTFLFNYLFAKKMGGDIVMRFEDTDTERSKKEYEEEILKTLDKLGLTFDRGPFRQTERTEFYIDAIETLLKNDDAYEAEESNDGSGNKTIRFRNPNKKVTYKDVVRGDITIDTTDFGDFVIARSKTNPLYHLTVVVDDLDMGITHVIRGEDHITSTPRQILLIEALGGNIPTYAHMSFTIGKDKKKLSKRHGATNYSQFEGLGYVPDALINYMALLGWNEGNGVEKEFYTREELINAFSLERLNNSPAMFSYDKLDDLNKKHILVMDKDKYKEKVLEFISPKNKSNFQDEEKKSDKIINLVIKEKISKFSEIIDMEQSGEFEYFFMNPGVSDEDLVFKTDGIDKALQLLIGVEKIVKDIEENNWNKDFLKESLLNYAKENGIGSVLHPLRTLLTGAKNSPDPFIMMEVLGKEETMERLHLRLS